MKTIEKKAIPEVFLQWLISSRLDFLDDMLQGKPLRYFSAHLPVMATWNENERFPVNLTVKGIGLIPRNDIIQDYIDLFESLSAEARAKDWRESLSRRINAMKTLYSDVENFNPHVLGGLEIFGGTALKNLTTNPFTSLLWVGMMKQDEGLKYISLQVNGKVEILNKENLYYRYLLSARRLFEFDRFHLFQPDYPFGYLIHVLEVRDKSPWSRPKKQDT